MQPAFLLEEERGTYAGKPKILLGSDRNQFQGGGGLQILQPRILLAGDSEIWDPFPGLSCRLAGLLSFWPVPPSLLGVKCREGRAAGRVGGGWV